MVSSSMASSNEYTDVAFQALGLPTVKIEDLNYQKTFPTKNLMTFINFNEVYNLKQEVQEKDKLSPEHVNATTSYINLLRFARL